MLYFFLSLLRSFITFEGVKNLLKILIPLGWIYGGIMAIRNILFNLGIFKSYNSSLPTISVGNLSMGGTGKTPHVDFIIERLKSKYQLAVLSRGYGRRTKGFLKVTEHSSAETVGDEPLLYKLKHKDEIEVAVCESRTEGAKKLEQTNANLLVLDDAYQHRKIGRDCNILITTYQDPFFKDFVVPAGNLREFRIGKNRAQIIVVSKCPANISLEEKKRITERIKPSQHQTVFFSHITYDEIIPMGNSHMWDAENFPEEVLLVTGIANPTPLENELKKKFKVELMSFPDHHNYSTNDLKKIHTIFDTFVGQKKAIITTEKDMMRLKQPQLLKYLANYPWFYQSISVHIDEETNFLKQIEKHVNANK